MRQKASTLPCSVEGCNRLCLARGLCRPHYEKQWKRTGPIERHVRGDLATRHAGWTDRRGPDECWPWFGNVDVDGYGRLGVPGHNLIAHRIAWELANGPIPEGMKVCHTCDNPPCQNPAHYFLGTTLANNQDRDRKGRGIHGSTHHQARLTEDAVRAIRDAYARGESTQVELAAQFGVTDGAINHVIRRRGWKHVA